MKTRREFIDFCLKSEEKIRIAIKEKRLDRDAPRSGGRGSGISRPTEIKAIRNLEPVGTVLIDYFVSIEQPENVLIFISKVKLHFNDSLQGKDYRLHYIDGIEDYKVICDMLGYKSSQTYYNHINTILEFAEGLWVEMFEKGNKLCSNGL